jgi:thioredoxin reductase (NADPH)
MYDIIIIGLGPAGVAAAVYAKRSGLKVLGIEKSAVGGLLNNINEIKNYPGYAGVLGPDLSYNMYEQLKETNVEVAFDTVTRIDPKKNKFVVATTKKVYEAKKIIIGIGRAARKLGINDEDKYLGHGLSFCAVCDGPLYKGKDVCVVGGGNSALQETVYLAGIVNKVYLIHRRNTFRASAELINQVKKLKNVEIMMCDNVKEIHGEKNITGVTLESGKDLKVSALFTFIGYFPSTNFLSNLNICNKAGYILVNKKMETKVPGIYAAGDIIKQDYYQIVTATYEGATAALNAVKKIKSAE